MPTELAQRVQRMSRLLAEGERAEALARWRLARCEEASEAARAAAARYRREATAIASGPDDDADRLLWVVQADRTNARLGELADRRERLHERLAQRVGRRRTELRAVAQARASCDRRLGTLAQSVREREHTQARRETEDRLALHTTRGGRP
jgi:hypothetical protein